MAQWGARPRPTHKAEFRCFCANRSLWELPKVSGPNAKNPNTPFYACQLDEGCKKGEGRGCGWFRWPSKPAPTYPKWGSQSDEFLGSQEAMRMDTAQPNDQPQQNYHTQLPQSTFQQQQHTAPSPISPRQLLRRTTEPLSGGTTTFVNARTGAPVSVGAGQGSTTSIRSPSMSGRMAHPATSAALSSDQLSELENALCERLLTALSKLQGDVESIARLSLDQAALIEDIGINQAEISHTLVKIEQRYQQSIVVQQENSYSQVDNM